MFAIEFEFTGNVFLEHISRMEVTNFILKSFSKNTEWKTVSHIISMISCGFQIKFNDDCDNVHVTLYQSLIGGSLYIFGFDITPKYNSLCFKIGQRNSGTNVELRIYSGIWSNQLVLIDVSFVRYFPVSLITSA